MESQQYWIAVRAAADMIEEQPIRGSYQEWIQDVWPNYEKMCLQVAQHHYVMRCAHREWCQESPVAFVDSVERARLAKLCDEAGLDTREFVSSAFSRHKNACLERN